ncbi:MAG: hypothetical protein EBS38_05890 [Actinobacteria bacterium]|nr:hypothetical protein [Actinomycetota bacterium]
MVEWLYQLQLWFAVGVGLLLVAMGLIGRRPSGFSIGAVAAVELLLLIQLAVSLGMVLAGEQAKIDTWEFFGYLLVALLIPVVGAIWALVERSKWSTVVLGAVALTIAVMLVRMWQIWSGEIVNLS